MRFKLTHSVPFPLSRSPHPTSLTSSSSPLPHSFFPSSIPGFNIARCVLSQHFSPLESTTLLHTRSHIN
uniref:Uncharacterized protein n=1 Tax=Octopus bimaculoides TaxID=37653 RepID=A0A0L8HYS1_OCTBM